MDAYQAAKNWLNERYQGLRGVLARAPIIGRYTYTQPWPPPADRPRLDAYRRYRQIYEGEHEAVYVQGGKYSYDQDREYLVINMCGEITDLLVDRLFGEPIEIRGPEPTAGLTPNPSPGRTQASAGRGETTEQQETVPAADAVAEWIEHVVQVSRLEQLLIKLATGTSYRGDGALKVRYDAARKEVVIGTVWPGLLFLETEDDDSEHVRQATIAYLRWGADRPYLFQEIHWPGLIMHRLYELHGSGPGKWGFTPERDRVELSTLPQTKDLPDERATGVDEILIVPIGLGGSDESGVWGRSDYADVDGLQGELNNRATQRAEVLDKHADPWMHGPEAMLSEMGRLDQENRWINRQAGEDPPGYITWDGQLVAVRDELKDLVEQVIFTAGLSPESFQLGEGGAESGRALKLRQHRTASAVRMRQRIYGPAIARAISLASKLANSREIGEVWKPSSQAGSLRHDIPVLEPEDVSIGWQDGLPEDQTEAVEREAMAIQAGIASKRAAMKRLYPDWTDEQIEAELAEIGGEKKGGAVRIGLGGAIEAVEPEE